jgi:signal transduction histidine kinase
MKFRTSYLPKILAVLILLFFLTEAVFLFFPQNASLNHQKNVEHLQHTLYQKKGIAQELISLSKKILTTQGIRGFHQPLFEKQLGAFTDKQIYLALLQADSLIYWTHADFMTNRIQSAQLKGNSLVFINSTWIYIVQTAFKDYKVIAFIPIKKEYPFENRYLSDFYYKGFDVNYEYKFSLLPQTLAYYVTDTDGQFLFSLNPTSPVISLWQPYFFISLLLFIYLFIHAYTFIRRKKVWSFPVILMFIALVVLRIIMQVWKIPATVYAFSLFDAEIYASSFIFPSLGDAFLTCWLFVLFIEILLAATYKFIFRYRILFYGLFGILLFVIYIWFYLWNSLIFQSNISFQLYNLQSPSDPSILAVIILGMITWAFVHLLWYFFRMVKKNNLTQAEYFCFSIGFLLFIVFLYSQIPFHYSHLLIPLFSVLLYFTLPQIKKVRLLFIMGSIALFSSLTVFYTFYLHQKKTENLQQLVALSLSNERDIVAQMLMSDIEKKLASDRILQGLLQKAYDNRYDIYQYLKGNYFYGFWNRYDLQVTICNDVDNLKVMPTNKSVGCFDYFSKIIQTKGSKFNCNHFYSIDNDYGEISYLGVFSYPYLLLSDTGEKHVYLELNRKLLSQTTGYPDLLIDENTNKTLLKQWDNYAKYKSNRLIQKNGTFPYPYLYHYKNVPVGLHILFNENDYEHFIYSPNAKSYIIVSQYKATWYQYLWAILFVFNVYTLLFAVVYILFYFLPDKRRLLYGFRFKYISSFIGVLLTSYIIIGIYTLWFFNNQFRQKNEKEIHEKMQSVVNSIYEQTGSWENMAIQNPDKLTQQLVQLSNVFYADINIFNPQGMLIATSRPALFEKGLIGEVMNADALNEIKRNHTETSIHKEKIGKLTYMSSYAALYYQGNLEAIVQLPYFTEEEKLKKEIYAVLINLSSIYLLFSILSFSIIVLLANGILKPLTLLQNYLKKIRSNKKIQPIIYTQNDEITALVQEYNRVLEALTASTEKLVQTERESAWRDIAKQIAHEIKNPLTPMKLTIQYLIHAKNEKGIIPDEQFNKTMQTLLEQIESLSAISSAFSSFANMPVPEIEELEMIEILKQLMIFFSSQETSIVLDTKNYSTIYINGDKNYIKRIFTNLITNAIQSIPHERTKKIQISFSVTFPTVIIAISDNGIGIPATIADHIFKPSFTTKSSGMGIGLTLVKNMTEAMGGSVYFKSKENEGTTFFVELPYIHSQQF